MASLTMAIQVVSTSDASYTMRAVAYLTSLSVSDGPNNLAISGNWSRSGALALGGVYSDTPVWFEDIVVSRAYGSAVGLSVSAAWSGVEYWGGTLTGSASYSVPARPWQAPAAPTGVGVARVSDASHTVTWTRNVTAEAPYEGQRVLRSTDGGGYADISGIISATATSYTDTTTAANHTYSYQVLAGNSTLAVVSAATSNIETTPTGPTSAAAVKSGADIVVTWTNQSYFGRPEIWHAANGVFDGAPLIIGAAGATGYTHAAPSTAVTHTYRVYGVSTSPFLRSVGFTDSNTVQLAAAPNTPTSLSSAPNPSPAAESVTLSWVHNPVDSSAQTKREVQRRKQGTTPWSSAGTTTSSTSAVSLTPGTAWGAVNGEVWEWQVRTWGIHADPSPWSATATLSLSTRPTANISTPGATVTTSTVTAGWTYYDAEASAQSAWRADLLNAGGTVVEAKSGVGTASSVAFDTTLPNGSSWTVRVQAADAAGLWSTYYTQAFTVAYAVPPTPVIASAVWDPDTATVAVSIATDGAISPQVAAVSADLWRSIDDGPWVMIATGLPVTGTVVDWSPTVAGSNRYRVAAISALPSSASSAVTDVTASGARAVFISGGPGFSVACRATSNVTITEAAGRLRVLRRFAGRALPMEFTGEAIERILTLAGDLVAESLDSTPSEWLALADHRGPHLWRDPDGRWLTVSLETPKIDRPAGGVVHSLSLTATEVDP